MLHSRATLPNLKYRLTNHMKTPCPPPKVGHPSPSPHKKTAHTHTHNYVDAMKPRALLVIAGFCWLSWSDLALPAAGMTAAAKVARAGCDCCAFRSFCGSSMCGRQCARAAYGLRSCAYAPRPRLVARCLMLFQMFQSSGAEIFVSPALPQPSPIPPPTHAHPPIPSLPPPE